MTLGPTAGTLHRDLDRVGRAAGEHPWAALAMLLAAALGIRVLLAVVLMPESGHAGDMAIMTDWARWLAEHGPGGFYAPDAGHFADYPPAYLYVLWLLGSVGRWLGDLLGRGDMTRDLIKVPFILADLGCGVVLYLLVVRLRGATGALVATAVFLFNPGIVFASTVWGQNDPIGTLVVLVAIYALVRGWTEAAGVAAVLALLVKFQYGFVIPIVLVVGVMRHLLGRSTSRSGFGRRDPRRIVTTAVASVATLVVLGLPFGLVPYAVDDTSRSLWHRFLAASGAFPGVTQNAFNAWMNPFFDVVAVRGSGITEGRVVDDTVAVLSVAGLTITWQVIGIVLFLAVVIAALTVLARRDDGLAVLFVALLIAVAFYVLPTRVHERYLYPALALAAPFVVWRGGWRAFYVAISAVFALCLYWVYTLPIGDRGLDRWRLLDATVLSVPGIYALSAVLVGALAWLVTWVPRPYRLPVGLDAIPTTGRERPAPGPRWRARWRARWGAVLAADGALGRLERAVRRRRPSPVATVALIALASLAAAFVASRIDIAGGRWLWNWDLPKIDYPLATFVHEAVSAGRLPLWNDRLGLGFPLYAEGQAGPFYPPNWLIFRLDPLTAMDVTRLLHLAFVGTGTGLLALRLFGSRSGALVAALVAVAGGAVTTKLEWWNLVSAYAWLPWVLLPLARRPAPRPGAVVLAGILWGVQALAGHPNTWVLTGLAAVVLLIAQRPRLDSLVRIAAFGAIGAAVGAVQLLPTLILTSLSVRSAGLSGADLFASAATVFDPLGLGFMNAFTAGRPSGWDLYATWYPDGTFALLEAVIYVGLPVVALAALGAGVGRARPWLAVAVVLVAIPVIAIFQPAVWGSIPILSSMRSPTRAYVVVALALGLLAAAGLGRVGRLPGGPRRAVIAVLVVCGWYAVVAGLAFGMPDRFIELVRSQSSFGGLTDERILEIARQALSAPFPLVAELAIGAAALALILVPRRRPIVVGSLVVLAAWPLLAFSPAANITAKMDGFTYVDGPVQRSIIALAPHRVLAFGAPGWWAGAPDQLAASGVADLTMFSSLDLRATSELRRSLLDAGPGSAAVRTAGIDVAVTFGTPCPGPQPTVAEGATICRVPGALHPPYWLPLAAAGDVAGSGGSPIAPREWTIDVEAVALAAVEVTGRSEEPGSATYLVDAPAEGWVWIDRAWWPAWRVAVDGVDQAPRLARGGQLVRVGPGRHEIRQSLVPWDAAAGLGAGIAAVAIALLALVAIGRRRASAASG